MRVERARYFLAAVEVGSLRAAAAQCGVSQPTIGQQISLLEEELDVVLLTRSRRGVRPTPAGQALLEPFARLVAAEDSVRGTAMESAGAYHGQVQIGAVSVTAETIVAPVVGDLLEHHPGLRFTVREGASVDIESAVLAGDLDFGVITMPLTPAAAGLLRMPILSAGVGVHVRLDHPLAKRDHLRWADLAAWPVVTMRSGTVLWEMLHGNVVDPDVVVQAMSARTVKVMVARGAGLGVLAQIETSVDIEDLAWIPLVDARPVELCLVQRKDAQPSRSALIVRHLIQAKAAEVVIRADASTDAVRR
ncbi:LysR family transcriptional regulator [Nocardioidaceae bacterium SCSIO 66511]|nr:LysR family transcriptional regulator [Nocardioidaceae bacterium SCSIO 66511]